jgi:hypothetical protein
MMHFNGHWIIDLSPTKKLNPVASAFYQTRTYQSGFINHFTFIEPGKIVNINHCPYFFEDIGKTALGQPPMQWHLATLKAGPHTTARAGVVALCASASGFACAGSDTAP